ncbi:D-alanyl-D-alanine carboxypeptidase family protein [Benzoatithermus flavus]|uniref:serine-type D-Ala-D-Ala carboxypeptidase n=1 Tax=Benzoatithermus flavus TaxID=3108223 RepID=A0ABU8XL91_9PROT
MRQRLLLALMLIGWFLAAPAEAFETAAKAAIIIDARTGVVLFEKNADQRLPPASMSKLMTAYMIFDRLKHGRLKLDDEITISEKAWKMGGSQMFLKVGDRVRVEDLIRGIIIMSGNDACVAMAEALAGSEEEFAREMTETARRIGLTNSTFANATGLDAPGHLMSVRDLATLARTIITEFPEYFKYYSEREFVYRNIKQQNRNPLIQANVPGADGMKTGYTEQSGYGLVGTAKRNDRRIIVVLAGLESINQRKTEGERLLEYGFREFQEYRLFQAGESVVDADVWLGAEAKVPLVPAKTVGVTLSHEARRGLSVKLRYGNPVPAPIEAGQQLGSLEISAPNMTTFSVPLVAGKDVPRAGLLGRVTSMVGYYVWGAS